MPARAFISFAVLAAELVACSPGSPRGAAGSGAIAEAPIARAGLERSDADERSYDRQSAPAQLAVTNSELLTSPSAVADSACNEQPPQPFLMRGSYIFDPDANAEERAHRRQLHHAAIEYRTRRYGYVEGFGDPSWSALEPRHYAKDSTFFGVGVRMNVRVLTALGCVEKAIVRHCPPDAYVPRVLDGLRLRNTFYDGEVSNHTYGIAIDIDPGENPCCGCIPPLSDWPRCKELVETPYERTRIPRCWIDSFAKFGFYWLGHDELEDTMHFEFLGDPDKIPKKRD